jgi:DnaJ-related protein SCJ1
VLPHTQHYTLEVPAGVPEGHEVVFEGEGDENPEWEAGDVIIRVRGGKKRGGWRRKESSLYWTESIGADEVRLVTLFVLGCGYANTFFLVGAARLRA